MQTPRLALAAGFAAALALEPAPLLGDGTPTARKAIALKSLTKEQIKALGDHDPIEVEGKVVTKAQIRADVARIKPEADAWHAKQVSAALNRFEKSSTEHRTRQKAKLEADNIVALAAVAKLRQEIEVEDQKQGDKKPTPCGAPHIVNISVGSGSIYPGMSAFLAGGTCFGSQQGALRIEGQFPGGAIVPPISFWKDGLVIVAIPANISGVPDQTAYVKVVHANGTSSNAVPVTFMGTRETKLLSAGDTIQICSSNALINDCSPTAGQTFDGVHSNLFDTSDGEDKIRVSLKHGWKLFEKDWTFGQWLSGGSAHISSWPQGQATGDVAISFSVKAMGYIRYHAWLYVEGPVGTSYK